MAHTEILTTVFTDIVGFTEKTANLSREQHRELLDAHDRLLLPLIKRFGGKRIKSVGDGMMLSFRSPTDAVKCGMALQDRLFVYNQSKSSDEQIQIRVALNVGEVSVERGDIFGDSVNLASRLEGITPTGEVYLTQAVYLAMNKAEVDCEHVDAYEFKGTAVPIEVYRAEFKFDDGTTPPFGNEFSGTSAGVFSGLSFNSREEGDSVNAAEGAWWQRKPVQLLLGLVVVAVVAVMYSSRSGSPEDVTLLKEQAREALAENNLESAGELAKSHVSENPRDAEGLLLVGHVQMARGNADDAINSYSAALKLEASYIGDEKLIRNVLNLVGKNEQVGEFIKAHPSDAFVNGLTKFSVSGGWDRRHSSAAILRSMDMGERVDEVGMTLRNLSEQTKCEHKLQSINKLRKLGSKRALPQLEELRDVSVGEKIKTLCYRSELKRTIAALQGSNQQAVGTETSTNEKNESGIRKFFNALKESGSDENSLQQESGLH